MYVKMYMILSTAECCLLAWKLESTALRCSLAIDKGCATVVAMVRGVWSPCNLTLFRGGWQKIVAQIRGVFRKMIPDYPPGGLKNTFSHTVFVFTPT